MPIRMVGAWSTCQDILDFYVIDVKRLGILWNVTNQTIEIYSKYMNKCKIIYFIHGYKCYKPET